MDSKTIREKYLRFFESKGHKIIDPAPLVLDQDPTTLFTSSGMQPLVPFLKGKRPHPEGRRLVNSQPSFRTEDIEEVGDNRHTTFFEMLGNWSLGDYFKAEQLSWIWEFLTKELELPKEKLHVSVFEGNDIVPKDEDSYKIWKSLGVEDSHIHRYGVKKNWWSRSGTPDKMPSGEIGGPDSEVFFEFTQVKHDPKYGKNCHPNCDCGRFLEIGNSVFIQYQKQNDGSLQELPQKNVDFGGGLERLTVATNNDPDMFSSDLFQPQVTTITGLLSNKTITPEVRVIVDHLRATTFLINSGVSPSNKLQGYLLRRLIRRAAVKTHQLGITPADRGELFKKLASQTVEVYTGIFEFQDIEKISAVILEELNKFEKSLAQGIKEIEELQTIDGKTAFNLYQTYGFPLEITEELAALRNLSIDKDQFRAEFEKHKELSRTASIGMFKGGLASTGEQETKYHTATHLLHAALRQILGNHVLQRGSNITPERLRFDFNYEEKLTDAQLKQIEELVNQKIQENLPVNCVEMDKNEAEKTGAIHAFGAKYGDKVMVYTICNSLTSSEPPFSREFCGGPHVEHTGVLRQFRIQKQESVSSGIRRIYAVLEQ